MPSLKLFPSYFQSLQALVGLSGVASLTACYAPSQDFPIGSDLWRKSNPELRALRPEETKKGKRVTIAVLDGGIDYNHPRIRGHIQTFATSAERSGRDYGIGFDLLGGSEDYFPHYSVLDPKEGEDYSEMLQMREHGTHVSGLATLGNPEIALLPVRVLPIPEKRDQDLTVDQVLLGGSEIKRKFAIDAIQHVAKGMKVACAHGARVLNMSLGVDFSTLTKEDQNTVVETLESGILATTRNDCKNSLLVVAAGNESREVNNVALSIPVTLEEKNIIGVGALKSKADSIASYYSNQGRFVDVFIRGSDVRSAVPGTPENEDLRATLSGTSMATPLISHLAARLLLIAPELTPEQLRALILNTADLKELTLETTPESTGTHEEAPRALPEVRMGLVANFAKAFKVALQLMNAPSDERPALESRFLKAPFEHGHSPF